MKKILIAALGLGTLFIAGCSTNQVKNQVIGNMGDVKVVRMTSMRVNDLLVAQGYFHNVGTKPAQGYYRCLFFDVNKLPIGEVAAWKFVTVNVTDDAYGDTAVKCSASDVEAVDFKIEFSNTASTVTLYK